MFHSYLIEIDDQPVGLVLRSGEREPYRFVASDRRVVGLEGLAFKHPVQAERAARRMLKRPRR